MMPMPPIKEQLFRPSALAATALHVVFLCGVVLIGLILIIELSSISVVFQIPSIEHTFKERH